MSVNVTGRTLLFQSYLLNIYIRDINNNIVIYVNLYIMYMIYIIDFKEGILVSGG